MKRVVLSCVILLSIMTGCVSSPWEGFPPQESQAWIGIGVSPNDARYYRANGFQAYDIAPWKQQGISSPNTVTTWVRAGFSASEASSWIKKGFSVEEALKLKKRGLSAN